LLFRVAAPQFLFVSLWQNPSVLATLQHASCTRPTPAATTSPTLFLLCFFTGNDGSRESTHAASAPKSRDHKA
jgi:hypothetical protein